MTSFCNKIPAAFRRHALCKGNAEGAQGIFGNTARIWGTPRPTLKKALNRTRAINGTYDKSQLHFSSY